ncbi:IS630 family transposase [Aquimarina sp. ERC-38]|uniref:IS630 family transposase n=1 Tax=Aquimarina sp. ERC-38 TaxID=2949996 RepID=UPI0022462D1D|nr:IS630 family transposase [Aquimarina sp. ERC-38]UZO79924.1 IS630 family transposase [Aquimarina sp. ERC-38]
MESPADTVLLFEDEFSLSNIATVGYQWSPKGKQPKTICKQRKRERQTAMGSYNFETGQITVTFHQRGNYQSFKKHLKKIMHIYRKHTKIIMVVDNVKFHHAKLLKVWLKKHPKLEIVYLPPYSPELNPVERAWWFMRKKISHNRFLHSLEERKVAFWKMFSHFQKPNQKMIKICEINF